jgi:hydroxysqualene synthase
MHEPAPLSRHARRENFPVASLLLARRVRPHVVAFYNFVRAADDIADSPGPRDVRHEQLQRFEDGLDGKGDPPPEAVDLATSIAATGIGRTEAGALLAAFRQDVDKSRYADLLELHGYCRLSAEPVGRFVLRLHGESEATFPPSDALCTALQLLNHLQDLGPDHRRLDRVYLPLDWLEEAGCPVEALAGGSSDPRLWAVQDRLLAEIDRLLRLARPLPDRVRDRRLRAETRIILALALALAGRLRGADPLAGRVRLGRGTRLATAMLALLGRLPDGR